MSVIDLATIASERVRPLKRDEYDRLIALGYFEDEQIELLAGFLVAKSPQTVPHAYAVQQLNMLLLPAVMGRAVVRVQLPLAISADSEPEPDIALVPVGDYSREHPITALLVIEVAESSLRKDRVIKAALYAQAGVPEYWVVDLTERVVHVHREGRDGAYARVTRHGAGEGIRPQAFDDVRVAVGDVVPAPPA
jgi:Uma2 family endonuclease